MRFLKMIVLSKHSLAVLKVACAAMLVINIYLLTHFFSWDNDMSVRKSHGEITNVRSTVDHPLAHLLPSQGQLGSVKKCLQPKLSLIHDTLAFAFYPMKPLNCSGSNFFYLHNGFLIANKTMKDKLKTCEVFAIQRESDNYSFLVKLFDTSGNTSLKINDDFIYLRCLLKDLNGLDTKQDGDKNLNDKSTVKIDIVSASNDIKTQSLLFDKTKPTINLFPENTIRPKLEKRSQFVKYKLHSNSAADNVFSNIYRAKRDVDKDLHISRPNSKFTKRAANYSKQYKAKDSKKDSDGLVKIDESLYTSKGSSLGTNKNKRRNNVNNVNFGKEYKGMQELTQERIKKTVGKLSKSTTKQQNATPHTVSQRIAELNGKSDIKFEYHKKRLPADMDKEEARFFENSDPDESEQNDLDESYDDFNEYPEGFDDDWEMEDYPGGSEEKSVDVPACGEEQILVQVSPLKHVFDRHKITKSETTPGLNVLMLGIDSMSNMAFRRKLPLTLNYLQKELGALVFEGYNIVGDGTTQALLPMFLGKLQQEITNILTTHLDDLDFVWKQYQSQGYVTMFAEDEPHLGVFNLRLPGFQDEPTDHYMRHFWQAQAGIHLRSACSSQYCTGSTPNHQYLLQYLHDFFHKYHGIPRFAVGYSGELSHNEVNPSEYLDKDLQTFLASLKADGYLKDTVVVIFADHGSRKGKLRRLLQGKLEERLPFLSMVLPQRFRKEYRTLFENLRLNTKRLTTPFDVHRTLKHFLDLSKGYPSDKPDSKRGISLLRPIPEDRTCSQAGIDTHWCTCVQEKPVATSDPVVKGAAQAVIDAINNLTKSDRGQCTELRLCVVHSASIVVPNLQVLKFHRTEETNNFTASFGNTTLDMIELQVTIETNECRGVFEATVQVHYDQDDTLTPDRNINTGKVSFNVFEQDISRINTYGSQSVCINRRNPHIMKFCCCRKYMQTEEPRSC